MSAVLTYGERMWTVSEHARKQMQRRGIRPWMVAAALELGECLSSRGDLVYFLTDKCLSGTPLEREAERLRGLFVVASPDGTIVTAGWRFEIRKRKGGRASGLVANGRRDLLRHNTAALLCKPGFVKMFPLRPQDERIGRLGRIKLSGNVNSEEGGEGNARPRAPRG